MSNRHTSELLDNDDVVLVVMQGGVSDVSQYGRVAMVNAGEAVLTANGARGYLHGTNFDTGDQFPPQPPIAPFADDTARRRQTSAMAHGY